MKALEQKSVMLIHENQSILERFGAFLEASFREAYVIETASNEVEAIKVATSLKELAIPMAVLVVYDTHWRFTDFDFLKQVKNISPLCKIIFISDNYEHQFLCGVINHGLIYKVYQQPLNEEKLKESVEAGLMAYHAEEEQLSLLNRLIASENEKNLIFNALSKEMVYIDKSYNLLWEKGDLAYEVKHQGIKCYEHLQNSHEPCQGCKALSVFEKRSMISAEIPFPHGGHKLVTYYPVIDSKSEEIGVLISFADISTRKIQDHMNEALLSIAKKVHQLDAVDELYDFAFALLANIIPFTYFCVAGEDFDGLFIDYLNGKDKLLSCTKDLELTKPYLKERMKERKLLEREQLEYQLFNKRVEGETELIFLIYDKILILRIKRGHRLLEQEISFVKSMVEQLKIGVSRIETLKKITYQANHDTLTGLYNKEYFLKNIRGKLKVNREVSHPTIHHALAVIDLNYFKEINDTYGHVVGDEVLFVVAQNILKVLRHGDVLARIGGDEFALLLGYEKEESLRTVLKRVQRAIGTAVAINDTTVSVGSAIGVVSDLTYYTKAEKAIYDADVAMYEAKLNKEGIGAIKFFEKEIEDKLRMTQEIEGRLNFALNNKEFQLQYQPISDLKNDQVVGYEALLRWDTEATNHVSPSVFIPIAEDAGYIFKITDGIFRDISFAMSILDEFFQGNQLFISINLSAKQLMNKNYLDKISQMNIDFSRIVVEVTEKSMLKNNEKAREHLNFLTDLGVRVHLDDYGTGYTSLTQLSNKDIEYIKIDGHLIREMSHNQEVTRIVESIIQVADKMGKRVIAEGIETKEQLELLKKLGCQYGQGYHISRPLNLDQLVLFHPIKQMAHS